MSTGSRAERSIADDGDDTSPHLVVVSCDSHIGPTLDQMRPFCASGQRGEFDDFAAAYQSRRYDVFAEEREQLDRLGEEDRIARAAALDRNLQTTGHTDMAARRHDMDSDGVAADVIYHSSQNGEPIPFIQSGSTRFDPTSGDLEMAAIGLRIYNRWLAEACSTDPDRHVGVVQIPAWDVDAALREIEWARSAGLRAVNFPSPRPGITVYDSPLWEPFWSACEALEMPLNTHVGGAGGPAEYTGPHAHALRQVDQGGWLARRGLARLLFGGVFERHPGLKLVLTEQNGEWWAATMREYDSVYASDRWMLRDQMPRWPSEYCAEHVYIGASYMASFEAEMAVRDGYASQVMWGSDYPHVEGTYQYSDDPDEPRATHLALRNTFCHIDPEVTRIIVGSNALRCYGLDQGRLQNVADQINAPTLEELRRPLARVPRSTRSRAFRTIGAWG